MCGRALRGGTRADLACPTWPGISRGPDRVCVGSREKCPARSLSVSRPDSHPLPTGTFHAAGRVSFQTGACDAVGDSNPVPARARRPPPKENVPGRTEMSPHAQDVPGCADMSPSGPTLEAWLAVRPNRNHPHCSTPPAPTAPASSTTRPARWLIGCARGCPTTSSARTRSAPQAPRQAGLEVGSGEVHAQVQGLHLHRPVKRLAVRGL